MTIIWCRNVGNPSSTVAYGICIFWSLNFVNIFCSICCCVITLICYHWLMLCWLIVWNIDRNSNFEWVIENFFYLLDEFIYGYKNIIFYYLYTYWHIETKLMASLHLNENILRSSCSQHSSNLIVQNSQTATSKVFGIFWSFPNYSMAYMLKPINESS